MSRMDIVVSSPEAGRDLELCVQQIAASRGDIHARIIVAVGDAGYQPPPGIRNMEVYRRAGADVFTLRAEGVAQATAPIVAITEDHCQVAPGWCSAILDAFDDPDTDFVKGPVENGAPCGLGAWANYYSNFAHYLAGWPEGPVQPTSGTGATLAWRREAAHTPSDGPRFHVEFIPSLAERDVRYVEGAHVRHWQHLRLIPVLAMQYHNARAGAAFTKQVQGLPRRSSLRQLAQVVRSNMQRFRANAAIVGRHPDHRRRLWKVLPSWFLVAVAIAWGQWVGLRRGPGDSAGRVA